MDTDKDLDKELEENIQETSADNNEISADENMEQQADYELSQDIQDINAEIMPEEIETSEKSDEFELSQEDNQAQDLITVRPVKFQQFELTEPNRAIKKNLDIMQDVSMHISVELGRTKSTIKEVMDLHQGSIVELNKIAGEQVEIYVNNKLIAKGEVIVIEDKFGVRVTSTNIPKVIQ